jgi:hypothetical protein
MQRTIGSLVGIAQRGQALLFVTVTMLVVLLAMLAMYSIGQLVNEKTRLQNTADAAAYSAAIVQARDYNLTAYMNRAMIANDVSVAQTVGMMSWILREDDTYNDKVPKIDLLNPVPGNFASMWTIPAKLIGKAAKLASVGFYAGAIANGTLLLNLNAELAEQQNVVHEATARVVRETVSQVITGNDKWASLSLLGRAAAALDEQAWLTFTGKRNPLGPWGTENRDEGYHDNTCIADTIFGCFMREDRWGFNPDPRNWTWRSNPKQKVHQAQPDFDDGPEKNRMAGVVTASLDPFSTDRSPGLRYIPFLVDTCNGLKTPNCLLNKSVIVSGSTALANDDLDIPPNWSEYWKGSFRRDDAWNHAWKAKDSATIHWTFTTNVFIPIANIFLPFYQRTSESPGALNWFGINDGEGEAQAGPGVLRRIGLPTSVSDIITMAASGNKPEFIHNIDPLPSAFKIEQCAKGKGCPGALTPGQTDIFNTALRVYRDTKNIDQASPSQNTNFKSPPVLVEVERDTRTISTSSNSNASPAMQELANLSIGRLSKGSDGSSIPAGCSTAASARQVPPVTSVFGRGNMDLGSAGVGSCMRAIAKAEAYFSRPNKLYARADNNQEYGSLYSPYWQARLIPTTASDQAASLILQGQAQFTGTTAGSSIPSQALVRASTLLP